ncbi:MAG: hypothetical protein OEM52_06380 [bacterium]|nr:hypothetical protein [bacterium]
MFSYLKSLFRKRTPLTALRLLHATHLRMNLPEILRFGTVDSYKGLLARYGFDGALRYIHDRNRYDLHQSLNDAVNVAIGRIPASYLFRLSGKNWRNEWIAIELDPTLLEWQSFSIAPFGAAIKDAELLSVENGKQHTELLQNCFAKQVLDITRPQHEQHYQEEQPFPPDVPTHPNCELLLPAPIRREHWKRIIVVNAEVRKTVRIIVEASPYPKLPIDVDETVFRIHPATKHNYANNQK